MKAVTVREFLHGFSKLRKTLAPGESVNITNRGKPLGRFTKEATTRIPLPNFLENARADRLGAAVGDSLLKKLSEDEAIS